MIKFFDLFANNKVTTRTPRQAKLSDDAGTVTNECTAPDFIDTRRLALAVLKQYVPIRSLDDSSVHRLPHTTQSYSAGSTLFVRGQRMESVYYLLEGTLELSPDGASNYQITAGSPRSHLPLNCGKLCAANALALTDVKIIDVSADLIKHWTQQSKEQTSVVEIVDLELPEQLIDNRFFLNFAQMYRENKLALPSLPTVALKLKQAMQEDIDVDKATRIIQLDPPLATKLIQITNSALYAPVKPIANCHDAVTRLGLNATRTLVMGISLKQIFHSKDPTLLTTMQTVWRNSIYLSSLCFVLAEETGIINPEDALLAGLISDIGTLPLLHFAEQNPEQFSNLSELEQAAQFLRAPVGCLMLHTLGFSEQLTQIPAHAEDWYFDSGEQLNLIDIVILAKLHSYIGTNKRREFPYLNTIPAYSKLKNGKLDPDFSLAVLHKAQRRINAALQILS